jgi:hypothetical protein
MVAVSSERLSAHRRGASLPLHVGYVRVSTQEQDLALQCDALQAAGGARIFTEKASGAPRDRPPWHAALDYMRPDETLVLWQLDRLTRSLRQLLDTIETLPSRQLSLRSLTEARDTRMPGGTRVLHLFGALAERARSIIRERTRAGLAAARVRGRTGGRPPALSAVDKQVPAHCCQSRPLPSRRWPSACGSRRRRCPAICWVAGAVWQRPWARGSPVTPRWAAGSRSGSRAPQHACVVGSPVLLFLHRYNTMTLESRRVGHRPTQFRLGLAGQGAWDGLGHKGRTWHEA